MSVETIVAEQTPPQRVSPKSASRTFALIGVAGFVAPKHLKAIRDTGNNLVAALDPHDSVGILEARTTFGRVWPRRRHVCVSGET